MLNLRFSLSNYILELSVNQKTKTLSETGENSLIIHFFTLLFDKDGVDR